MNRDFRYSIFYVYWPSMDLITHSMTGLLIGSVATTKKDKLYAVLLAAVVASALLDVLDVWLYLVDVDLYYHYHRVYTHTLVGAPLYAALGALPAWLWVRARYLFLYIIALVSILVHLGMDLLCEWPVLLLYPLSHKDFAQGYIIYSSRIILIIVTALAIGILYARQKMEEKN